MLRSPRTLLAPLLAAACASPPEPLSLPERQPAARYALAAPAGDRAPTGAPLALSAELFAVAAPPDGVAVATAASAIIRDRGLPFRGSSRLPIGARWLSEAAARAWLARRDELPSSALQALGAADVVVAPTLVSWLEVADAPLPQVRLQRAPGGTSVSLITPADADADAAREELKIAAPVADGEHAALFVPAAPLGLGGYLLLLRATDAPSAAAVADAEGRARDAAQPAARADRPQAWQVALSAVGERNRRPALLALVAPYELPRAIDLVLAADEPALIAITAALAPLDPAADDVAFRIERAVWRATLPRIEREELTPSMFAAVVRHLGAVADAPSTLDLLLQAPGDERAFAQALREENLAALDDRSAAVRVAAHIWLANEGVQVAAYDPMADKHARRRALRRHWQEASPATEAEAKR